MAELYGRKIKAVYIGQGEGKPAQKCLVLTEDEIKTLKTEVAREIFEEIEKILVRSESPTALFYHCSKHSYVKLKKKYAEAPDEKA